MGPNNRMHLSWYIGHHRYAPLFKGIIDGRDALATSIDCPPYWYVLSLGGPLDHLPIRDITTLSLCDYEEEQDIRLDLLCGFGHTPFPLDYRPTAAINADCEAGKKNTIEHVESVKWA